MEISKKRFVLAVLACLPLAGGCAAKAAEPAKTPAATTNAQVGAPKEEAADEDAKEDSKKIAECNALIEVINKGVQKIASIPTGKKDSNGTAELRQMADAMDDALLSATEVRLTIPELVAYRLRYAKMARDVANSARDMASAADMKDLKKINDAQASLEIAIKEEDPIVDGINGFCQGP